MKRTGKRLKNTRFKYSEREDSEAGLGREEQRRKEAEDCMDKGD
jgi:hypothetical protein